MTSSQSKQRFEQLVDQVTCNPLEQFDWMTTLKLRNMVKKGEITPKHALSVLKRKLFSKNPVTSLHALEVLEDLVYYSGPAFQEEFTKKSNCKMLRKLVHSTRDADVMLKLLDLIRFWAQTFGQQSKHKYIRKAMSILKADGYEFQKNKFSYIGYVPGLGGVGRYLEEQDQLDFGSASNDPEQSTAWRTEACRACDIVIRPMERRYHCRDCREVFCYRCAPAISRLGLERQEVLCDNCYAKLSAVPSGASHLPPSLSPSAPPSQCRADYTVPRKTKEELREEEEELQHALALSRAEAEEREKFMRATPLVASTSHATTRPADQSASQSTASNQSGPSAPPAAAVTHGLTDMRLTEEVENELTCGICFNYFKEATTLLCSHSFCYRCISSWRQEQNDCPICRSQITGMAPSRALDNMVAAITNLARPPAMDGPGKPATFQAASSTSNDQIQSASGQADVSQTQHPSSSQYVSSYLTHEEIESFEYVEDEEQDDEEDNEWEGIEEDDDHDDEYIQERAHGYNPLNNTLHWRV